MYGHEGESAKIRADTVQQMRDNKPQYVDFLPIRRGGGIRSNPKRVPKRKNVGAPTYNVEKATTAEDVENTWTNYLHNMSKSGVFADNLEIQAFTQAYEMDVVIFRFDHTILHMKYKEDDVERPVAFVALHVCIFTVVFRLLLTYHLGLGTLLVSQKHLGSIRRPCYCFFRLGQVRSVSARQSRVLCTIPTSKSRGRDCHNHR